ncbi:MAG: hypothetical protein AB1578_22995 [Thermodesulfobacteriota bacterium]
MQNYLSAEALIVARLQSKVAGVKAVLSAADLDGVAESAQVTPAVHVVFGGYRPTQERDEGRVQESEQVWIAVVAVRNLRTPKTGEHARETAGELCADVLAALQGWRPSAEHQPLKLAPGPRPGFSKGYGYFPLAFTTRVVTRGQP